MSNQFDSAVERLVEKNFQSSGCTKFPTVREVARELGLTTREVVEEVEGNDNLMLTYWYTEDYDVVPDEDRFVEALNVPGDVCCAADATGCP